VSRVLLHGLTSLGVKFPCCLTCVWFLNPVCDLVLVAALCLNMLALESILVFWFHYALICTWVYPILVHVWICCMLAELSLLLILAFLLIIVATLHIHLSIYMYTYWDGTLNTRVVHLCLIKPLARVWPYVHLSLWYKHMYFCVHDPAACTMIHYACQRMLM